MLSLNKLSSLPKHTRTRKVALLLQGIEEDLVAGKGADTAYVAGLFSLLRSADCPRGAGEEALAALSGIGKDDADGLARLCNRVRHGILSFYDLPQADWDLRYPASDGNPPRGMFSGMTVFLDEIRSPYNVGAVFRSSESFGFGRIHLAPRTASPEHPRARRTAIGTIDQVTWRYDGYHALQTGVPVFALETGGTAISEFRFPREGIVILGNEELGIGKEAREAAEASWGIVTIPRYGRKGSLNLSVAFGILAYSWTSSVVSSFTDGS
jgi:TrmH family RNA methyltransferase